MEIKYRQLSLVDALRTYADWLLEQQIEEPARFFKCCEHGRVCFEWYMILCRTFTGGGHNEKCSVQSEGLNVKRHG